MNELAQTLRDAANNGSAWLHCAVGKADLRDAADLIDRLEREIGLLEAAQAPVTTGKQKPLNDDRIHEIWHQSYIDSLKDAGFGIGNGDVAHMNHPVVFARALERELLRTGSDE